MNLDLKEKIEVVPQITKEQHESTPTFLGKFLSKIDGGKLYKLHVESKQLSLVEIDYPDTISLTGKIKNKLILEKGYIYVEALNPKNAIKRILKGKGFKL